MSCARLATAESRHAEAISQRKRLDAERDRRRGIPVRGLSVDQAVADFVITLKGENKEPLTVASFEDRIHPFQEWARDRVRTTDDLTLQHIEDFREHVLGLTRRRKRKGTARKARGESTGKPLAGSRKTAFLNCALRFLRACARHLPDRDVVRALNVKAIKLEDREVIVLRDAGEIRTLLKTAMAFDASTTRGEWWTRKERTPPPVAAIVLLQLLTGLRPKELPRLAWPGAVATDGRKIARVDFAADGGKGAIHVPKWGHNKLAHVTGLGVSPAARDLLRRLQLRAGDSDFVFGPFPQAYLLKELRRAGAPRTFTWENVRHTTQSVQFRFPQHVLSMVDATARLGHSLATACKHYVGKFASVPATVPNPRAGKRGEPKSLPVTTLEQAMGIADLADQIVRSVHQPAARARA